MNAPDLNDIPARDWVATRLPRTWRPYARLMRLDRPIGTWPVSYTHLTLPTIYSV